MAKKARLLFALISSSLALSIFITGCQSARSNQTLNETDKAQDHSIASQSPQTLAREQAIRLASELGLPAQIAIAGLGLNSTGLNTLKTKNANCGAWADQLSGFLAVNKPRQTVLNNEEVKISLTALQLIASGQFLMDIPTLVLGVSNNVVVFPLELYLDVKKLEAVRTEDKAGIQNLRQELLDNINAVKNSRRSCRLSVTKYLKSKIGLVERHCTPKISAPVLEKLRDLAVPTLAFNTANDIVKNDTAWTAVQIYALIHGWTVTDVTRIALEEALAENPDLGPLVDSGVDVLLRKENADTVIGFLGKLKEANNTCGPKDPLRLNDDSVVTLP